MKADTGRKLSSYPTITHEYYAIRTTPVWQGRRKPRIYYASKNFVALFNLFEIATYKGSVTPQKYAVMRLSEVVYGLIFPHMKRSVVNIALKREQQHKERARDIERLFQPHSSRPHLFYTASAAYSLKDPFDYQRQRHAISSCNAALSMLSGTPNKLAKASTLTSNYPVGDSPAHNAQIFIAQLAHKNL